MQNLLTIIPAAEDLREAIGELCVSVDVRVVTISQGTQFRQDLMEDAYVENGGSGACSINGDLPSKEEVVGAVGLGVIRGEKEPFLNGKVKGHCDQPAKVALLSTLLACCSTCSAAAKPRPTSTSETSSTALAQAIPQSWGGNPGQSAGVSGTKEPGAGPRGDSRNGNKKNNTPAGQEKSWWQF